MDKKELKQERKKAAQQAMKRAAKKEPQKISCVGEILKLVVVLVLIGGSLYFVFGMNFAYGSTLLQVQFIVAIILLVLLLIGLILLLVKGLPAAIRQHKANKEETAKLKSENPQKYASYIDQKTGHIILRSVDYTGLARGQEWVGSGNAITIKKGGKSRSIPLAQISDIVQRSCYLSFRVASRPSVIIQGTTSVLDRAAPDEAIAYEMQDTAVAKKMAEFLSGASATTPQVPLQPQPPVPAPQSVADELAKLRMLLDDGTITQEEFEHKKKKLLGM